MAQAATNNISSSYEAAKVLVDDAIQALKSNDTKKAQAHLSILNQQLPTLVNSSTIQSIRVLLDDSSSALNSGNVNKAMVHLIKQQNLLLFACGGQEHASGTPDPCKIEVTGSGGELLMVMLITAAEELAILAGFTDEKDPMRRGQENTSDSWRNHNQ